MPLAVPSLAGRWKRLRNPRLAPVHASEQAPPIRWRVRAIAHGASPGCQYWMLAQQLNAPWPAPVAYGAHGNFNRDPAREIPTLPPPDSRIGRETGMELPIPDSAGNGNREIPHFPDSAGNGNRRPDWPQIGKSEIPCRVSHGTAGMKPHDPALDVALSPSNCGFCVHISKIKLRVDRRRCTSLRQGPMHLTAAGAVPVRAPAASANKEGNRREHRRPREVRPNRRGSHGAVCQCCRVNNSNLNRQTSNGRAQCSPIAI
jgi:hypothetical protein